MTSRPRPVSVVAWLQIIVGILGIVIPVAGAVRAGELVQGTVTVASVNLVWLISGILLLRRITWAQWLSLAWLVLHVGIAALHYMQLAILHALLLPIFAYALFSRESGDWFRSSTSPG